MPRGPIALLISSLVLHSVAGRWTVSPWLLPDLSLIGLAMAVEQAPSYRRQLLLLAVIGVMLLAGPAAVRAGAAYGAFGGALIWFAGQWDAPPRLLKAAVMAAAELLLIAVWWIGDGPAMTWPLLIGAVQHLAFTVALWWALQWWRSPSAARE